MGTSEKRKKKQDNKPSKKKKQENNNPLERLEKVINSNYFITLQNCPRENEPEVLKIIKKSLKIEDFSIKERKNSELFLAFSLQNPTENKTENFGVILGPNAETEREKIADFQHLWGKENCKLRIFQDGSTHESVSLNNPSGPNYVPLAKLTHILKVHFAKIKPKFHHFNEDFRFENVQRHESFISMRQKVDKFCSKLRELMNHGTSEMPLRKIEAICSCLYKGEINQHCHEMSKIHQEISNKVVHSGRIREKSNLAPCKLSALPIELEITQKNLMSNEMFARLKMAYILKLKDLIQEKLQLKTILKRNGELLVIEENQVFAIKIKPPNQLNSNQFNLQEILSSVGLHFSSFSGVCHIVKKWISSQFLSLTIEEQIIDMITATVFQNEDIFSCENGFLKVLHLLSFTDFQEKYLFLGSKEHIEHEKLAKIGFDFQQKREKFPSLAIFAGIDLESSWTKSLSESHLRRLVNCARMTLHGLSNGLNFDSILNNAFKVNEELFDALIILKPAQIPVESNSGKFQGEISAFPIVDYDPLKCFWKEINESFAKDVQFYCSSEACKIGLKTNPGFKDLKTVLEDIQVLGKDLVKEITIYKK